MEENKVREGLGVASLVIGIISLILSFVVNIFILPLALLGLIFGIVNICQKGHKRFAGIILNLVATVVSFIMMFVMFLILSIFLPVVFIALIALLGSFVTTEDGAKVFTDLVYLSDTNDFMVGTYDCRNITSTSSKNTITIKLNSDNTFEYGPYQDLANNHYSGKYSYSKNTSKSENNKYKYYDLNLNTKDGELMVNGYVTHPNKSADIELGIKFTKNLKREVELKFKNTNENFVCTEVSTSSVN